MCLDCINTSPLGEIQFHLLGKGLDLLIINTKCSPFTSNIFGNGFEKIGPIHYQFHTVNRPNKATQLVFGLDDDR